jgi:hypothetical protein
MKSPYKYLDYFSEEDHDLFFGRDKEIEILLADITIARLVVLFARTGTGKTSLIRAGVSPRLEELGYITLYAPIKEDPYDSLYQVLGEKQVPVTGNETLPDLFQAARRHFKNRPLVVFFDQFEEFFFGIEYTDPPKAQRFVREIAQIHYQPDWKVHIVFSLREDFYGGMDIFREQIPFIFHNNSNLRLLALEREQARRAIVGPAQRPRSGFTLEDDLVEQLVNDLTDLSPDRRVEPAHLQIICHTLWKERKGRRITVANYEAQGGRDGILASRVRKDLDATLNTAQLEMFSTMIDLLTNRKEEVKRPRSVEELVEQFGVSEDEVVKLIDTLVEIGLLRKRSLENVRYVEWVTDYVAKNISELENSVWAVSTQKLFKEFVGGYRKLGILLGEAQQSGSHNNLEEIANLSERLQQDFFRISQHVTLLTLSKKDAKFMLLRALEYQIAIRTWFALAEQSGADVWRILGEAIARRNPTPEEVRAAENAVRLLGDLLAERVPDRDKAWTLLESALRRQDLAEIAVNVLGMLPDRPALELLNQASRQPQLVLKVIGNLGATPESVSLLGEILERELGNANSLEAGLRLNLLAKGRTSPVSRRAEEVLEQVLDAHAEDLFDLSVDKGVDMKFWFQQAQRKGVDAWEILETRIDVSEGLEPASNVLRLLKELGDEPAERLLQMASQQEPLGIQARQALQQISSKKLESESQEVSRVMKPPTPAGGLAERDWDFLLRRIRFGKCTPLLGAGVNYGILPLGSEIARQWAEEYEYPLQDKSNLANVAQYLAVQLDSMFPKEEMVRTISRAAAAPDFSTYDEPHIVLADLPLPVYLTTNYDDFMVKALQRRGKDARSELCKWNTYIFGLPSVFDNGFSPTPANPVVFHLFGHNEVPESLVLTRDDYLDFLVSISRDPGLLPPRIQEAIWGSSLLWIGYSLQDWTFQVLYRFLFKGYEKSLRRINVGVQLLPVSPDLPEEAGKRIQNYLDNYFEATENRNYWGTAREFANELRRRWDEFSDRG